MAEDISSKLHDLLEAKDSHKGTNTSPKNSLSCHLFREATAVTYRPSSRLEEALLGNADVPITALAMLLNMKVTLINHTETISLLST